MKNIFGIRKRKRTKSTSSSSGLPTFSVPSSPVSIDDPEVVFNFYSSPVKKRPKRDQGNDNASIQQVDEDVSFKISDTSETDFKGINQLIDEEISFRITEVYKKDSKPATIDQPRRSPNGYILPDPLPEGLIISDLKKGKWRLGKSIGLGGFGEIYAAASWNEDQQIINEEFVVKVEPHTNGPLFMEINFYLRAARCEDIKEYKKEKHLKHLGVPKFIASGSFIHREKKLRFLVMPRFGTDLQTVLDGSGDVLSRSTACSIGAQVIDCYEYLHSKGYVHKDVKGSNLLFSRHGTAEGKVFLVDYGLVSKLTRCGIPKPNVPDDRSAHEGTLEFCSRDAHLGCVSRRGDFEVLLFNVIDWVGGKLPWDKEPQLKPKVIQEMKEEAFSDTKLFLRQCFKTHSYPAFLETMMDAISQLQFHDIPDYNFFRSIFINASPISTSSEDDEVFLSLKLEHPSKRVTLQQPSLKQKKRPKCGRVRRGLRNQEVEIEIEDQGASEKIFLKALEEKERLDQIEVLKKPTPAMLEQIQKMQTRKLSPDLYSTEWKKTRKRRRKLPKSAGIRRRPPAMKALRNLTVVLPRSPASRAVQRNGNSGSIRKRFESMVENLRPASFLDRVSKSFLTFHHRK